MENPQNPQPVITVMDAVNLLYYSAIGVAPQPQHVCDELKKFISTTIEQQTEEISRWREQDRQNNTPNGPEPAIPVYNIMDDARPVPAPFEPVTLD